VFFADKAFADFFKPMRLTVFNVYKTFLGPPPTIFFFTSVLAS